jgi:GNAT superfamily N-acetyltransferase
MKYTVRLMKKSDLEHLAFFFVKAYGSQTIFKDINFLNWFFYGFNSKPISAVALSNQNKIIAFYGAIKSNLSLGGKILTLHWGVNAYTLKEYRGLGIGESLLQLAREQCDIFGVIGFTKKTAQIYSRLDFNLFNYNRARAHILALNKNKCIEISKYIGADIKQTESMLAPHQMKPSLSMTKTPTLSRLNQNDLHKLDINTDIITTYRSPSYLTYRFLDNPYIHYQLFGIKIRGVVKAIIVIRRVELKPKGYFALRIVDLFGPPEYFFDLLSGVIQKALNKKDIYIEFTSIGSIYDSIFENLNFVCLKNSDLELLPQVTNPIEIRPNNEYLGLFSSNMTGVISKLKFADVYFTRADSDRDRAV